MADYYTAAQIAAALGLTADGVRWRIRQGRIRAERIGRDWLIARNELERLKVEGLRQRPGPKRKEA
jgi:excisionase family DNA binding protein